jgi:hypothetical protein
VSLVELLLSALRKAGLRYLLAVAALWGITYAIFRAFDPYPLGGKALYGMAVFYAACVLVVVEIRAMLAARRAKTALRQQSGTPATTESKEKSR